MIKSLIRQLGLDRVGEVLAEEVRRLQVEVLRQERDALARMLANLDARIAGLGGKRRRRLAKAAVAAVPAKPATTKKPRRRKARLAPKPGETLRDMIAKALAKAGGPVKVPTLVDLVLEAGYKTNAKRSTLVTSTYTVLTDRKLFRKMGKGVFALAAAPAKSTRQRAPRKRRKAAERKRTAKEPGSSTSAARTGETLQYFILQAFRQARRRMKASEIAKRVKTLGYRTTSTSEMLLFSIERVLEDEKLFRSAGRELYELALPVSTKGKARRPRKRRKMATKKAAPAAAKEQGAEVGAKLAEVPATKPDEQSAAQAAEVKAAEGQSAAAVVETRNE